MKTIIYIVQTTTGDKWELCGGSYLVRATSCEQAAEDVLEYLKDNGIVGHKVIDVKAYYTKAKKYDVECIQEPIIE